MKCILFHDLIIHRKILDMRLDEWEEVKERRGVLDEPGFVHRGTPNSVIMLGEKMDTMISFCK